MEPIRHTKTARLPSLRMYREELDQLVALFQKSCAAVTISDNKNRYESLEEMKATIGPKIKNLDIRGEKPGLHFLLNQKEFAPGSSTPAIFNELRTEEITDEAEALFFKVKEFLLSHQRPTNIPFLISAIVFLISALVFDTFHNLGTFAAGQPHHISAGLVICIVLSLVCGVFGVVINGNNILLESRLNSPSFFVRNREDFARHAVTAAISGIIGLIFGWFVGHFLK